MSGELIKGLKEECDAYKQALEFYAKEIGYMPGVDLPAAVYMDSGKLAQETLARFKEK